MDKGAGSGHFRARARPPEGLLTCLSPSFRPRPTIIRPDVPRENVMIVQSVPTRRGPAATRHNGFSRTRLARMSAALQRHIDEGAVPGLVALVRRRGQQHLEALGTMAYGSDVPM